jgi:hypothetical protein
MATVVYLLCALTSSLCAVLLLRDYVRKSTRLLLTSSLAFVGLAISNALVFVDFVVIPGTDLAWLRAGTACIAVALLVHGLVRDTE